jgi:hypothetical protein
MEILYKQLMRLCRIQIQSLFSATSECRLPKQNLKVTAIKHPFFRTMLKRKSMRQSIYPHELYCSLCLISVCFVCLCTVLVLLSHRFCLSLSHYTPISVSVIRRLQNIWSAADSLCQNSHGTAQLSSALFSSLDRNMLDVNVLWNWHCQIFNPVSFTSLAKHCFNNRLIYTCISVAINVNLSVYPSIYLSICLSMCLSVCLSVRPSIFSPFVEPWPLLSILILYTVSRTP